jgi:hypothetical protein
MLRNTYLGKLYASDRLLLGFITSYIICELACTILQVEVTPCFLFGMYSQPQQAATSYPVYSIMIDGRAVRSEAFHDAQRELVYNTIAGYDELKRNKWVDPLEAIIQHNIPAVSRPSIIPLLNQASMDTPYQQWLLPYIADMRMIQHATMTVTRQQVRYDADGALVTLPAVDTLLTLQDE